MHYVYELLRNSFGKNSTRIFKLRLIQSGNALKTRTRSVPSIPMVIAIASFRNQILVIKSELWFQKYEQNQQFPLKNSLMEMIIAFGKEHLKSFLGISPAFPKYNMLIMVKYLHLYSHLKDFWFPKASADAVCKEKYQFLTHSVCDSLQARDANASIKNRNELW